MEKNKPATVNEYLESFPLTTQEVLQKIRQTIQSEVPKAEEKISYAIPAFFINGRVLIYFAGYKNHVSIYPAPRNNEKFKSELSAYKGGKGTVQFPLNEPIPYNLVKKIVRFKLEENEVKARKTA